MTSYRIVRMAEWLAFVVSDYEVLGLSPARGGIQLMTIALHCTEPFIIILLSSQYD